MTSRWRAVAQGLKTFLLGWSPDSPGEAASGRYCHSVWLRHLALLGRAGMRGYPKVIAELGPGSSLGLGLAGLLGGADRYVALDVIRFAENTENVRVFEELVDLYERQEDPAGDREFPRMHPRLSSYRLADVILDPDALRESLAPERVQRLRQDITGLGSGAGEGAISYICPWFSSESIEEESVDAAFSQAVLEHVNDLEGTYAALFRWMKKGAMMSHQIDFKCHGVTEEWNGHLAYSDPVWKMVLGRRPCFLNRQVLSTHLNLQERAGFRILAVTRVGGEGGLPRRRLARRYRDLSDEDLATSSAHVISVRP